jgi:hypothetical protein
VTVWFWPLTLSVYEGMDVSPGWWLKWRQYVDAVPFVKNQTGGHSPDWTVFT